MEQNEPAYPCHLRLLGAQAVVLQPHVSPHPIEPARLLRPLPVVRYASIFAGVNHYAHRSADTQDNLIATRGARIRLTY